MTAEPDTPSPSPGAPESRPRIAFLTYSSGMYDARTQRMARWAVAEGFDVTVYARQEHRLPAVEQRDGYRIVRVPWHALALVPGFARLRRLKRRGVSRVRRLLGRGPAPGAATAATAAVPAVPATPAGAPAPAVPAAPADAPDGPAAPPSAASPGLIRRLLDTWALSKRVVLAFPIRPMVWAFALRRVAEPADIWHGMWAGSLPASARLARRHGGGTIYDSRDVYMESRDFSRSPLLIRRSLAGLERRWARRVDRVLTVNEPYADLIERQLGVPRPPVVMNCPERWTPPDPRPDLFRQALDLPRETAIVAYQGLLITERGIEQAMDAILDVPDAVLVLLGWGKRQREYERQASVAPYLGRVFVLPPVPPDELLRWTASADVSVMAIQPTTVNHRFTTPQKLFESFAAGTPVVASDLPGMADVVRGSGVGVLCDPTSPASIAAAIRSILDAPAAEQAALRARVLAVAHETYAWETQLETLRAVYGELLDGPAAARAGEPR